MKKYLALVLVVVMALGNVAAFAEGAQAEKSTLVQTVVSAVPLSTWKTSPVAKPKMAFGARSSTTDEELTLYKQMGYTGCELSFSDDELKDFNAMKAIVDRLRNFPNGGFEILLATNGKLQKNTDIHLAYATRDAEIERMKEFIKNLSALDIHICAIAWQPFGISRSGDVPKMTHGADTGASDLAVIMANPNKADRVYPREELWQTFEYFINAILPTCEEFDVAMALHPNDPPVPYLDGIGSLIITADDYRRAFEIAHNSPYLGMKLCTGCWLEGGLLFSDDFLGDIAEFTKNGKVLNVHFRNVSGPLHPDYTGYFEETLAAEGYGDMYAIMKTLIANGFEGPIHCDHSVTQKTIDDSWIMGLIYAARAQVGYEMYAVK